MAVACQYCGNRFVPEEKQDKVCPKCGRRFPQDSNFCPHCGVELQPDAACRQQPETMTKVCPACQAVNLKQRSECHKCGHKFESADSLPSGDQL